MENQSKLNKSEKKLPKWRYQVAITIFIVGNAIGPISPAFMTMGMPAEYIIVFLAMAPVANVLAIILLGKQGFKELKAKVMSIFKRKPVEELMPVSRFRHVVGIILTMVLPYIMLIMVMVFGYASYAAVTPDNSYPEIWGMDIEQQKTFFFTLMFGAIISAIVGIFVLGGLWWDRFRQLFAWPGKEFE